MPLSELTFTAGVAASRNGISWPRFRSSIASRPTSVLVTGVFSSARTAWTTTSSVRWTTGEAGVAADWAYELADTSTVKSTATAVSNGVISLAFPYAGSNRIRFRGFDLRPFSGHP